MCTNTRGQSRTSCSLEFSRVLEAFIIYEPCVRRVLGAICLSTNSPRRRGCTRILSHVILCFSSEQLLVSSACGCVKIGPHSGVVEVYSVTSAQGCRGGETSLSDRPVLWRTVLVTLRKKTRMPGEWRSRGQTRLDAPRCKGRVPSDIFILWRMNVLHAKKALLEWKEHRVHF